MCVCVCVCLSCFFFEFLSWNALYVVLQDLVGLVISILLLGDFSLVLLTLLQLYSFSLADVFLVLFITPLGIVLPFPAGINALFSHGPRRPAGLARVYALWNVTSLINIVSCFILFDLLSPAILMNLQTCSYSPWTFKFYNCCFHQD